MNVMRSVSNFLTRPLRSMAPGSRTTTPSRPAPQAPSSVNNLPGASHPAHGQTAARPRGHSPAEQQGERTATHRTHRDPGARASAVPARHGPPPGRPADAPPAYEHPPSYPGGPRGLYPRVPASADGHPPSYAATMAVGFLPPALPPREAPRFPAVTQPHARPLADGHALPHAAMMTAGFLPPREAPLSHAVTRPQARPLADGHGLPHAAMTMTTAGFLPQPVPRQMPPSYAETLNRLRARTSSPQSSMGAAALPPGQLLPSARPFHQRPPSPLTLQTSTAMSAHMPNAPPYC